MKTSGLPANTVIGEIVSSGRCAIKRPRQEAILSVSSAQTLGAILASTNSARDSRNLLNRNGSHDLNAETSVNASNRSDSISITPPHSVSVDRDFAKEITSDLATETTFSVALLPGF